MNPIATLFVEIGADLDKLKSGLGQAEGMIGNIAGKLGGLALGVGAGLVGVGAIVGKVGFDFLSMQENAVTAFTTMLGSASKAQDLLKDLQQFAAATPFEFPEIASASKSLLAFGIDAKDMTTTLQRVGDIASGVGAPLNDIAELYGKAKVQGRLFAQDINQLTGRGIPIIQELAKQFGVSEGEVMKLVEQGKVGFPNLEEAFRSLTSEGGKFSGMMEAQSHTFDGMMSTLKDNLAQLAGTAMQPFFEIAKKGMEGLISFLSDPAVQAGIQNFANNLATGIGQIGTLIQGALPFVQQLVGAIQGLFAGGGGGNGFTQWLGELGGALNEAGAAINEAFKPALDAVMPLLQEIGAAIGPLIATGLAAMGEAIVKVVIPALAGLVVALLQGVPHVVAFAREVGGRLNEAFATAQTLWGNLVKGFQDAGRFIDDTKNKLADIAGAINNFIGPALQTFNDSILQPIVGTFNAMMNAVKGVVDWLNELARILGVDVGKGFMDLLHQIGVPGFAGGTEFAPGGMALVGENGPELVNLPRGSRVTPMSGGGMTLQFVYAPRVSLLDEAEIETTAGPALVSYLRSHGFG